MKFTRCTVIAWVVAILGILALTGPASAVLAVDGTPTTITSTGGASQTITISTTGSLGTLLIAVASEQTTAQTVASVTAAGLTFTKRTSVAASLVNADAADANLEEWEAPYSSQLVSEVVTVTFTASIDCAVIVAFPYSGGNTSSPFDPTSATAAVVTANGSGVSTQAQTTTNANDILIFIGTQVSSNIPTIGKFGTPNATAIYANANGSSQAIGMGLQYLIVSATQAGISDTMTTGWTGNALVIADAVVQASAGGTSHNRLLLGVGK